MLEYHRTKKESRIISFIALLLVFILASIFGWLGMGALVNGSILGAIFLIAIATGLFVLIFLGARDLIKGPKIFVLSVDDQKIQCGLLDKERTVRLSDILEIYWNDSGENDLTVTIKKLNGKYVRFPEIEFVLPRKCYREFIHHMWEFHPSIPIVGDVMGKRYRRKRPEEIQTICEN